MSEPGPRLLVVDDEPAIRRFLRTALAAHGFQVFEAASGRAGLDGVLAHRPDLVILDWGLPDLDGVEVLRRLREWSRVPIIMLTVREAEADKVAALDAGADDYLTKPFGAGELMARIRAALRHAAAPTPGAELSQTGDLSVDLARRLVLLAGAEVSPTPPSTTCCAFSSSTPARCGPMRTCCARSGAPAMTICTCCASTSATCAAKSSRTRPVRAIG